MPRPDRPRPEPAASPAAAPETAPRLRLQRYLAIAGIGSRRKCEELILAGRVMIDGETVSDLGVRVDPRSQDIRFDGERLKPQPRKYYLLHKPTEVVCTNVDPQGRTRAIDLVPQDGTRLFTVGRLDAASLGLILVTNDGDLAQRLAHPRYQVVRTYRVQVAGNPTQETLDKLQQGIYFEEGKFRVRRARRVRSQGKSAFLELQLTEGQNREIRRLLARVGHKVMRLERIGYGPLKLGRLPAGSFRPLTTNEIDALRGLVRGKGDGSVADAPPKSRTAGRAKRGAPRDRFAGTGASASRPGSTERSARPRTGAAAKAGRKPTGPRKPRGPGRST